MEDQVRKSVSTGSTLEAIGGYDRAVRVGQFVFVAGTTGFDYKTMTISDKLDEQVAQALANVDLALSGLSASRSEIVRTRWMITDRAYFAEVGKILADWLAPNRPPATTIVCDLVDARMLFEIEVTAIAGHLQG